MTTTYWLPPEFLPQDEDAVVETEVNGLRIQIDKRESGLLVATSRDMPGFLAMHADPNELLKISHWHIDDIRAVQSTKETEDAG